MPTSVPAPITIYPTIVNAVQGASALGVQRAIQRLKREQLRNQHWLGKRNRYLHRTTEKVDHDSSGSNWQPKFRHQLAEYIGASSVLHSANGWTFLSQSVKSLLDGDLCTAVHLAYYAELRAAMSLLASEGIGIFNMQHVWIDVNENCTFITPPPRRRGIPTHEMVRQAIHAWGNESKNAEVLLELFRIQGHNLKVWLDSVG